MGSGGRATVALSLLGVLSVAVGCGSTGTESLKPATTGPQVPPPPIARGVPYGYRASAVWRVDLSGGPVRDAVVTSVGPPVTSLNFHSADLRVLEWDPLAHHWGVAFDAQKVDTPDTSGDPGTSNSGLAYSFPTGAEQQTPILDPKADTHIEKVRFASLLPGRRRQLLFSATSSYGGSGVPQVLAVVDFQHGVANVTYAWNGEGLEDWRVAGGVISARAEFWTPADPHCCPLRTYRFTVQAKDGSFSEMSDDRPWLGVTVQETESGSGFGPLEVTEVDAKSPAASRLRVGDVILDVTNAHVPTGVQSSNVLGSTVFDKFYSLYAGQTAEFQVARADAIITVPVRLRSVMSTYRHLFDVNDYTHSYL